MSAREGKEKPFGLHAFRRSLGHFVLGKGASAIASILVLIIVVRELSLAEFAVYTTVTALILVVGKISSFGIDQVLIRYLPELRTQENFLWMYRLIIWGTWARALGYALFAALVLVAMPWLGPWIQVESWLAFLPYFMVLGFVRVNANFFSRTLESLLWQKDAQYSLAGGNILKLAVVAMLAVAGMLDLGNLLIAEIVTEGLAWTWMWIRLFMRRNRESAHLGAADWLSENWRRLLRYAAWGSLQNASTSCYGSAANRLVASMFLAAEAMALFGIIDRLVDYARRYMPTRLFVNLVRPVFFSRYTQTGDFSNLVRLSNLLFKVNLVQMLLPLAIIAVLGDDFFDWFSGGKLTEGQWLFIGFYLVAAMSSVNPLLDMLAKTVEENRILLLANIVMSFSTFLAIPFFPALGLWSLVLANATGVVGAVLTIKWGLGKQGWHWSLDSGDVIKITGFFCVAVACGLGLVHLAALPVIAGALVSALVFAGLLVWSRPLAQDEYMLLRRVLDPSARRRVKEAEKEPGAHIACEEKEGGADMDGTVSVIVTTKNRPLLLEKAVNSVLSQHYQNFELIVVDDGSDPPVSLASQDERIRLIRHPASKGGAAARNTGIAQSRGRYLCFLDDDDEYYPHKLDIQVRALEAAPALGAVFANIHCDRGDGVKSNWLSERFVFDQRTNLVHNRIHLLAAMIRKEALGDLRFDERLRRWQDRQFFVELSLRTTIGYIPDVVGVWNRDERGDRISRQGNRVLCESQKILCQRLAPVFNRDRWLKKKYYGQLAYLALAARDWKTLGVWIGTGGPLLQGGEFLKLCLQRKRRFAV